MQGVEASGKTVDEAIASALEQLALDREEADVEILSEGKGGLFGLGSEPARVRVSPRAGAPVPRSAPLAATPGTELSDVPKVDRAIEVLEQLLNLMHIEGEITAREPETPGDGAGQAMAVLDVTGPDLGVLIGRRGETLGSLQYLINLVLSRQLDDKATVVVDVAGYRRRREESLTGLAKRMANRVRATGRTITLEPMPANERRIVHLALADDEDVQTASVGEGDFRKVALSKRR